MSVSFMHKTRKLSTVRPEMPTGFKTRPWCGTGAGTEALDVKAGMRAARGAPYAP